MRDQGTRQDYGDWIVAKAIMAKAPRAAELEAKPNPHPMRVEEPS